MARKKIIVLGIGNYFMRDNAIGVLLTKGLKEDLELQNIEFVLGETDTNFMLSYIESKDFVIVIGGIEKNDLRDYYDDDTPRVGDIRIRILKEVLQERAEKPFKDNFDIIDGLLLYYKDIDGYFIGIEMDEVAIGVGLSKVLEQQFGYIQSKIEEYLINIVKQMH